MMISVGTEFICGAERAVSFPVIAAVDTFLPGAPSSGLPDSRGSELWFSLVLSISHCCQFVSVYEFSWCFN